MNTAGAAIPRWQPPSLPVAGSGAHFRVRRIFCVGRNYTAHAREMGHDPDREPPFFFMKPGSALAPEGGEVPYPPATRELHHEVELVVALGTGLRDAGPATTLAAVYGYAVGIDLTRRDLQAEAKRLGRPWEVAKAFDGAAPCGPLHSAAAVGHPITGAIWLDVNGERRQEGDLAQMIWTVPEVLAELSRLFGLLPGDLVFTGTPAGVGPLQVGNRVAAGIDRLDGLTLTISPPRS